MNLLLDTQIFIWLSLELEKLTPKILPVLRDPTNRLFISTASVWEMQIKFAIGKLSLFRSVEEFVQAQREYESIQPLPVFERHVWTLAKLPLHHRDPFDRILIAQAIHEDFTLVTVDALFSAYPVKLLP